MSKLSITKHSITDTIISVSRAMGLNPAWALAIAEIESSLGNNLLSPTGAKGVFQMTTIAMKDLLLDMANKDNPIVGILCGLAFLHLLKKRWNTEDSATVHFCDPKDRDMYLKKMIRYRQNWEKMLLKKDRGEK